MVIIKVMHFHWLRPG